MSKYLLDVNLSPQTGTFLRKTFSFDVVRSTPPELPDEDVVAMAKREGRVIITLDQDFGEIYYLRERGHIGVLVLRLRDQTVESVNRVLRAFFQSQTRDIDLDTSLVVIGERQVRVVRA